MPYSSEPGTAYGISPADAAVNRDSRHRGWSVAAVGLPVIGWLIVAVLGLVAILRLVAWDSLPWLIVLNALTLEIYLPAWILAVGALVARRWWLGAAAVSIVVAQVAFMAPELLAVAPVPAWASKAPSVRVLDANLDKSFSFQAGYVHAIEQDHPDLITLEEITPSALETMSASGVLANFHYRCSATAWGATGLFVASAQRLTNCHLLTAKWNGQSVPYMIEATWWSPAGPVALRVVHTLAPFPAYWREWAAALTAISQSVRATGASRMLMVGDFNASWDNRGFAALLNDGLTDGAAARGKAIEMTWPNGAIVPPFVRIDHVLTGSTLAVTGIATGPGFGSDHRYMTATVAVSNQ